MSIAAPIPEPEGAGVQEAIESYLASFPHDRPRTRLKRRDNLDAFLRFCTGQELSLEQLTYACIEKYHQWLLWTPGTRGPLAPNTIYSRLAELRGLLRWALRSHPQMNDPTVGWKLVRPESREKKLLTRAQLHRLLNESTLPTPIGLRNQVILEAFAELGFSALACQHLDLADADPERYRLYRTPISHRLAQSLTRYLQRGRPVLLANPDETALFLTQTGHRAKAQVLSLIPTRQAGQRASMKLLRRSWLAHRDASLNQRLPSE